MKKKKLQFLVSLAQIISSLAVLISIFLLIIEYKRSGTLNERSIENLIYSRVMEMDRLIIENPDLAEILSSAQSSTDSLTVVEKMRYLAYEHIFYDSWETLWVAYQDGSVERRVWEDWNRWFLNEAHKKPPLSWEGNMEHFSTEFLEYIRKDLR